MDSQTARLNRFLQNEAEARNLSVEGLLDSLRDEAKARIQGDCLRVDELENIERLPPDRQAHAQECDFCRVLAEIVLPDKQRAEAYAEEAVRYRCGAEPCEAARSLLR